MFESSSWPPPRKSNALAFARTSVRFSRPYRLEITCDFGELLLVARCDASLENTLMASLPHAPYDSTIKGMHTHPSSKHFAPFSACFLCSATTAADPAVRPASWIREEFSGEVTERSRAAGLLQTQLETRMSAGRVFLCSLPRPLPASTLALIHARWQVWSTMSLSLLCLHTASPPLLHVKAWWPRGSRQCSGHNAQGGEPGEVFSPSHPMIAIWCSLGSRLSPRPGDGTTAIYFSVT